MKLVPTRRSIETSHVNIVLILNDVRATHDCDRAIFLLLHFALLEHSGENVRSRLVISGIFLRLRKLLLQLMDSVFLFVFKDIGQFLKFKLTFDLSLRSTTL